MMELTPAIKKLIEADANLDALQAQAIKDGFIPLKIAGLKKVAEGQSVLEEVLRVAPI